jgi:predicted Zn-ribbon and HTH transcriptional regulator
VKPSDIARGMQEWQNEDLRHVIKTQREKIDMLKTALRICKECAHEFRTGDTMTALLAARIADTAEEALND